MSFIRPKDREEMDRILDSLNVTELNNLEKIKFSYKGSKFIPFLDSLNDNFTISDVVQDLEYESVESNLQPNDYKISSFDDVKNKDKFTQHFKNDYDLLDDLLAITLNEQSEDSDLKEKARNVYSRYELQHNCLKQSFICIDRS